MKDERKSAHRTEDFHRSSGNVFADLTVDHPEEELAKTKLARLIRNLIQERGLTQEDVAKMSGVDRARISNIINGRLASFTFDRLFRVLNSLEASIQIVVGDTEAACTAAITVR